MAVYTSKYPSLSFYVEGNRKQFSGGRFFTENKAEIEVLEKVVDAVRVEEPVKEEPKEKPKAEKKAEEPKKKASPKRKTSAK